MSLRRSHNRVRVETPRPAQLADGVAAPAAEATGPFARDKLGRFATSEAARAAGAKGGRQKSLRSPTRVARELRIADPFQGEALGELPAESSIRRFMVHRETWAVEKVTELSRDVGGGVASAGVTALVRAAAQKLAYADFLFAVGTLSAVAWDRSDPKAPRPRTDLAVVAARLTDSARQDLLGAHELAAREAAARRAVGPTIDLGAAIARLAAARPDPEDEDERGDQANGGGSAPSSKEDEP